MDLNKLEAHWGGFFDEHSPPVTYHVGVGSADGLDDILKLRDIGQSNSKFLFIYSSRKNTV